MSALLRLALGSGSLRPDWREPLCGFVFRLSEDCSCSSWRASGRPEGIGSIPVRLYQTKDSSVVEQVIVIHHDAGSNPAPALRFSLNS